MTTSPTFTVITTFATSCGSTDTMKKVFASAKGAERYCTEEMKWESTVRVQCTELSIDVEGDFVGVSHTFTR